MAALMPDATSIEEFWQNIIDAHVSIKKSRKTAGTQIFTGKTGRREMSVKARPTPRLEDL